MISVSSATVLAGSRALLDDVTFAAEPGELVALVGPNGAGKTTLLRLMSGERVPDRGDVTMAGRPLRQWSTRDRARMRAVVAQDVTLEFPFTAIDVVLMGRTPHLLGGSERPVDHEIAASALDAVGMLDAAERIVQTLSGGERQRVHLARALAQLWQPGADRVLLLDEPTSSLDIAHQHAALALARRFSREGAAVVAVLHDLNLAAQYGDRMAMLDAGRLVAFGSPNAVLSADALRRVFGIDAVVMPHPRLPIPLVVPLASGQVSSKESDA